MNRTGCIYVLVDPDTLLVRYVGQTITSPRKRYASHIYQWKRCKGRINKINSWIKSLSNKNKFPIMEVIEDNISEILIDQKEIDYIKLFKAFGAKLCNHTEGGQGTRGYKPSKESIQKRLETIKNSEAWKEKHKKQSEIMKEKHREGVYNFGYVHLPLEKRKEIGGKHSKKMKENYQNGMEPVMQKAVVLFNAVEELFFKNQSEAARFLGLKGAESISRRAKGKIKVPVKGYNVRYNDKNKYDSKSKSKK